MRRPKSVATFLLNPIKISRKETTKKGWLQAVWQIAATGQQKGQSWQSILRRYQEKKPRIYIDARISTNEEFYRGFKGFEYDGWIMGNLGFKDFVQWDWSMGYWDNWRMGLSIHSFHSERPGQPVAATHAPLTAMGRWGWLSKFSEVKNFTIYYLLRITVRRSNRLSRD